MVGYLVSLDSSEQLSSETQSISNNKARVNVAMYENIHNLFRKALVIYNWRVHLQVKAIAI